MAHATRHFTKQLEGGLEEDEEDVEEDWIAEILSSMVL